MQFNNQRGGYFARPVNNTNMTDLFETPELMPANLQAIVDKYAHADNSYEMCGAMLVECKAIGYTFDFYLDAMPYNLRPIKK